MNKGFQLQAEVKATDLNDDRGGFLAIASTSSLDRDGEVIDAKAFEPLPASVPVHVFHDFTKPVGRGVPRYDGKNLLIEGKFASTPLAQEYRTLVSEGIIGHVSVGFMPPETTKGDDSITHITKAELLEVSFTSVPSNREAAVLMSKSLHPQKSLVAALEAQVTAMQATIADLVAAEDLVPTDGGDVETTATDPELQAAAQAAAEVPAEVPVDDRAQATLALLEALIQGAPRP